MISLSSEPLFFIGQLPITNTVVDTIFVDFLLILLCYFVSKNVKLIPGKLQTTMEMIFETFLNLTESVSPKHALQIFPFIMTFFLFILISNWSGLLPIVTTIGLFKGEEFIPLIRSASTDLNVTLALALVSLIATHTMSIRTLGIKQYIGRFISLDPLSLYTGILEIISEFTKIISFSFRLFGNIYVGEVMLASLSTLFAFLLPIPLILYEFFVGTIQATIFALLTMAFMAILTTPHHEEK